MNNLNDKEILCVKHVTCSYCNNLVLLTCRTIYNTYICENCIKEYMIISD